MKAYLALGANIGPRRRNIESALASIDALCDVSVVRSSTCLDNPSVGGPPDAPDFLNAAAEIETTLSAELLLEQLLRIEQTLGRVRGEKNAPRPIDLDLLLYGDHIIHVSHLSVPHPRMHERLFVLRPLAEIAPDVLHPVLRLTIRQLLQRLTDGPDAHHR